MKCRVMKKHANEFRWAGYGRYEDCFHTFTDMCGEQTTTYEGCYYYDPTWKSGRLTARRARFLVKLIKKAERQGRIPELVCTCKHPIFVDGRKYRLEITADDEADEIILDIRRERK